jgi:hypothetical protein
MREHGHGYIVGRDRLSSGERCTITSRSQPALGPNVQPASRRARRQRSPKTLVQEVASKEPGMRVFVVHSDELAAYEGRQRAKAMDRVRARLRNSSDGSPTPFLMHLRRSELPPLASSRAITAASFGGGADVVIEMSA